MTENSGHTAPAPQGEEARLLAFVEWFRSGPDIAMAAGLEVQIVAITSEGASLEMTSAGFSDRAALAATEGSADE